MKRYNRKYACKESFIYYRIINSYYSHRKLKEQDLSSFAYNQLNQAGLFDGDSDYNEEIGSAVFDLIKTFASQGHSGFSAQLTRSIFNKLTDYVPINPVENPIITGQYSDVSIISGLPEGTMFQGTEISNLFSDDGGNSWYLLAKVPNVGEDGVSYCTYEKRYITEFPFNYDDYIPG